MKRKIKVTIGLCVLVMAIFIIVLMIPSSFVTTTYTIKSSKVDVPVRIAHLSDIHNKEYGEDNAELIQAVAESQPDLIFITGDSVSMDDEDITSAISLVEKLVPIAPVYYSYGNHEMINNADFDRNIGELFAKAGAKIMEFSYEDVEIKGQKLRIGGLYGFCLPERYIETGDANLEECAFLNEFQDTDRYTMFLAHLPVGWLEHHGLDDWDVDCIFSGHSHGGQFDLPFLGPVFAPDQGWFPEKVSGLFTSQDGTSHMVVSRGLGDSVPIPRVNNPTELIIVNICPDEKCTS